MPLRRSNELNIDELREILSLPNHLIAIINPDGTFYKVNAEANPVLGWEPEEIVGKKVRDYVHPEDWEETYAQMTRVFLGSVFVVEDMRNRIRRKDGTWRWISWTGKAKGGLLYVHGNDVTEKIEYEEAFTVQSLVLENISEGVTICNGKGVIVFANTAAEKLYGYELDELLGKNIFVLSGTNDEGAGESIREIRKTLDEDQVWKGEFENKRKDGVHFASACRVTSLDLNGERHYVCVQRDISNRKRLSREREELETRFRTFFEQSPLGMIIFDLDGRPLEINHAWEMIFAVSRDAFKDFRLFSDPFAISMGHIPYIERALAGEVVMIPPFFIDPQPKGTVPGARSRWLEVWFSPIKGPDNKTRELACILKDITIEVETRKSLEELEAKYRTASESLSLAVKVGRVGIWEWLPKENQVLWNETSEEIFGYDKGSSSHDKDWSFEHFYPDDRARCLSIIDEALKSSKPYSMDYRIRRKDGVVRWVQGAGMPFYNERGEVSRVIGTVIDITERKEQEEDQNFISNISEILSSSFEYIENIQKVLELATVKYFDGAILDEFNRNQSNRIAAAAKLPGDKEILYSLHELETVEVSPELLQHFSEKKEVIINDLGQFLRENNFSKQYIDRALTLNLKQSFVISLHGKSGPVGVVAFHYRNDNSNNLTERNRKIAREIAERISFSLENSLLYHHSQEAIRARDEFLSIASHELKTPLQSLTLQNQMSKRALEKGGEGINTVNLIRALEMDMRQLARINRLIDDMLDISRIRNSKLTLQKENFNLIALLDDIVERIRPQFEIAGCEIRKNYSGLIEVNADSYRIEQVIINILNNAMKYGSGSPVDLELKKAPGKVILEIQDHGPGVSEQDRERIFHRFERVVSNQKISGLGLGLYIAREIMELHHGAVYVESSPGKGATFIMELPL